MKKHATLLLAAGLALGGSAALAAGAPDADAVRQTARQFFQPIPTAEAVIQERGISPDSIELGRWLFFEPRLSRSHIISCNTCHSVGTGGADNIQTSIGHGWQKGPRDRAWPIFEMA